MSLAEWPVGLDAVATWTDKTVLAGDENYSVTLLALTPNDDGLLRADPVPMMPRGHREGFGFGYGGGTPATTYASLLRCVLRDQTNLGDIQHAAVPQRVSCGRRISTTKGSLRLIWPQVQMWARADRKAARI